MSEEAPKPSPRRPVRKTKWNDERRRAGLQEYRKEKVHVFDAPEAMGNLFRAEVQRATDAEGRQFAGSLSKGVRRLVLEWLEARGLDVREFKRGIEYAMHPATAGCFA